MANAEVGCNNYYCNLLKYYGDECVTTTLYIGYIYAYNEEVIYDYTGDNCLSDIASVDQDGNLIYTVTDDYLVSDKDNYVFDSEADNVLSVTITPDELLSKASEVSSDSGIYLTPLEVYYKSKYTTVNQKYIEDSSGNKISPVTSADSVYTENGIAISNLVPVVLYKNASGSNEEIMLSDSAENYEYMEIFARNNNTVYTSVRVENPNGKVFYFVMINIYESGTTWTQNTRACISGSTITPTWYGQVNLNNISGSAENDTNYFYITKVIGYKEVS